MDSVGIATKTIFLVQLDVSPETLPPITTFIVVHGCCKIRNTIRGKYRKNRVK